MKSSDAKPLILFCSVLLLGTSSLVFSAPVETQTFQASFDCSKARSKVEISICRNERLADADSEMASLYKSLLDEVPDSDKKQLKHEQRNWLRARALCGSSKIIVECLTEAYAKRIDTLKGKKEALSNPPITAAPADNGQIDIPYTVHKGELQVLGYVLRSEDISAEEDAYYVSFHESPGKRWIVIGYDEPFEKTLVWLYDTKSKTAPVPVKAKRVGRHFGVDWYGDSVFAVYFGGMGYKTSQLFSVSRPEVYKQVESIVQYDPIRDLYATFAFDKDFIFYITVGRAFHSDREEKFPIKLYSEDLVTAIASVEQVKFGSNGITVTYQTESGVVTETFPSKIVESAKK